jgi:23S rRNA (cytosine1962-C5)-methyltransferase
LPDAARDIAARLHEAADRRWATARGESDAFRVANSAGDDLPGLEVDRYGDHAVVALTSDEAVERQEPILDAVFSVGFAGVYLKVRRPHASVLVDTRSDVIAPSHPLRGIPAEAPMVIREHGVPLHARLGDGLSTGVFLDQRDGRRWLALRGGERVLNLFAYHGAFTVAAVVGGATHTVTVDSSGVALAAARENLALVGATSSGHEIVKADAFSWLRGAVKHRRQFDVVVLDPPSFSTTKKTRFRADRDYAQLAALALGTVAKGGALLACTNHRGIVRTKFEKELIRAAERAAVTIRAMTALPDPTDFPSGPYGQSHLKRIVVEV